MEPKDWLAVGTLVVSSFSFVVATLAFRLASRSQGNPLRVELYKKQVEFVGRVVDEVTSLNQMVYVSPQQAPQQCAKVTMLANQASYYLPSKIAVQFTRLVAEVVMSVEHMSRTGDDKPLSVSIGAFLSTAKLVMLVDELSASTLPLVNSRYADHGAMNAAQQSAYNVVKRQAAEGSRHG